MVQKISLSFILWGEKYEQNAFMQILKDKETKAISL